MWAGRRVTVSWEDQGVEGGTPSPQKQRAMRTVYFPFADPRYTFPKGENNGGRCVCPLYGLGRAPNARAQIEAFLQFEPRLRWATKDGRGARFAVYHNGDGGGRCRELLLNSDGLWVPVLSTSMASFPGHTSLSHASRCTSDRTLAAICPPRL